ncbi:MAG: hypothetical protein QXP98_07370 [Thermoproteus sp.]
MNGRLVAGAALAALALAVALLSSWRVGQTEQTGLPFIVQRSYALGNGTNGLYISYNLTTVNGELVLFIYITNRGNETVYIPPNYIAGGSIITICLSTPVGVSLASGYYGPSQLDEAAKHELPLITYLPLPVYCPIFIRTNRTAVTPGDTLTYWLPITGLFGPNTTVMNVEVFPIPPDNYTIIITDMFNQTVLINVRFNIYIGAIVYKGNDTAYVVMPVEPKAIYVTDNRTVKYCLAESLVSYDGIIKIVHFAGGSSFKFVLPDGEEFTYPPNITFVFTQKNSTLPPQGHIRPTAGSQWIAAVRPFIDFWWVVAAPAEEPPYSAIYDICTPS